MPEKFNEGSAEYVSTSVELASEVLTSEIEAVVAESEKFEQLVKSVCLVIFSNLWTVTNPMHESEQSFVN